MNRNSDSTNWPTGIAGYFSSASPAAFSSANPSSTRNNSSLASWLNTVELTRQVERPAARAASRASTVSLVQTTSW